VLLGVLLGMFAADDMLEVDFVAKTDFCARVDLVAEVDLVAKLDLVAGVTFSAEMDFAAGVDLVAGVDFAAELAFDKDILRGRRLEGLACKEDELAADELRRLGLPFESPSPGQSLAASAWLIWLLVRLQFVVLRRAFRNRGSSPG
jgi:hypothetical protein